MSSVVFGILSVIDRTNLREKLRMCLMFSFLFVKVKKACFERGTSSVVIKRSKTSPGSSF